MARQLNREWAGSSVRAHAIVEYYRAATDGFAKTLRQRGYSDAEIGRPCRARRHVARAGGRPGARAGRTAAGPRKKRRPHPAFRAIPGAPRRARQARHRYDRDSVCRRPSAQRWPTDNASCHELSAARICNFRSCCDLRCSCSLLAFRIACLCILDHLRRAGPGDRRRRLLPSRRRFHGARNAAGRRSGESVQRDHRRQGESRARERPAARVRAAHPVERRLRDRPGDVQGRRQVQGGAQPAARRAVVGPAHAVGGEQRREHEQGQPDAGRPEDRQARQADRRRRSVQHVLLTRRQVRDRRCRGD